MFYPLLTYLWKFRGFGVFQNILYFLFWAHFVVWQWRGLFRKPLLLDIARTDWAFQQEKRQGIIHRVGDGGHFEWLNPFVLLQFVQNHFGLGRVH